MKCYLLSAPFLSNLTLSLPGHCPADFQSLDFNHFISSKYQRHLISEHLLEYMNSSFRPIAYCLHLHGR